MYRAVEAGEFLVCEHLLNSDNAAFDRVILPIFPCNLSDNHFITIVSERTEMLRSCWSGDKIRNIT